MTSMFQMIQRIRKSQILLMMLFLTALLLTAAEIGSSQGLGDLTTLLSSGGIRECLPLVGRIALLYLAQQFITYIVIKEIRCSLQNQTYHSLYTEVQEKSCRLSYDHPMLHNTGDFFTLVQSDVEEASDFMSCTLPDILTQTVNLILILIYVCLQSPVLFVIYMLSVAGSLLIQMFSGRAMEKAGEINKNTQIEMNRVLKDVLSHRRLLKTYDAESFAEDLYQPKQEEYAKQTVNMSKAAMPLLQIGILCGMLPMLVLCAAGVYMLPKKLITLPVLMTVYYLCQTITPQQLHYAELISSAVKAKPSLKRILSFLQETDAQEVSCTSGNSAVLEHVYYRYPGSDHCVLKDVSLTIEAGSNTALIGESGSGKSTVMKLIAGLITPEQGTARAGASRMTQQFPYLFDDTVKDNITCHDKEDSAEYTKVCRNAYVDSFAGDLPEQDHTLLQENASNLSGGQKQRIAIARSLYHTAGIMMYDESLSALDASTADQVMHALLQHGKEETLIMTLHQLEFLPLMDRIIAFSDGTVVFDGDYVSYQNWKMQEGK